VFCSVFDIWTYYGSWFSDVESTDTQSDPMQFSLTSWLNLLVLYHLQNNMKAWTHSFLSYIVGQTLYIQIQPYMNKYLWKCSTSLNDYDSYYWDDDDDRSNNGQLYRCIITSRSHNDVVVSDIFECIRCWSTSLIGEHMYTWRMSEYVVAVCCWKP